MQGFETMASTFQIQACGFKAMETARFICELVSASHLLSVVEMAIHFPLQLELVAVPAAERNQTLFLSNLKHGWEAKVRTELRAQAAGVVRLRPGILFHSKGGGGGIETCHLFIKLCY